MRKNRTGVSRRDFLKATGAGSAVVLAGTKQGWSDSEDHRALPTRILGRTRERVCTLGLGTAPAGHRPRREAAEFYDQAITAGVTYIDTAPEFAGYGVAQQALGDIMRAHRDRIFLVTKCFEPDGDKALQLLKRNLKELQTDHADLVYAHSIGDDKMDLQTVLGKGGVMPALEKARQDGLCRFIGVSGHNRPEKFLKVLSESDVQVMMNAVNPVVRHIYNFEERVWPTARRQNVGLVAMKVLGGQSNGEQDPKNQPRGKGGRIRGEQQTELAFRYAMGLPDVATVVLGCYDMRELNEAIAWTRTFEPLPEERQQDLLARGRELAKQWGPVYGPVEWKAQS